MTPCVASLLPPRGTTPSPQGGSCLASLACASRAAGKRQGGAALLAAMLTVVLVATLASAALWQQWRDVEIETAERNRVQANWLLLGALDWSRVVLQEDSRANRRNPVDHLGEPWAVPLRESRLSTFLAATNNVSQVDDGMADVQDAFLSGEIVDLQSRLNLRNLLSGLNKTISEEDLTSVMRLFERLGVPSSSATQIATAMQQASRGNAQNASLMPRTVAQLTWLGIDARLIARIEPYVTLLPQRTPVNLNTASAEVIWATTEDLDWSRANQLVQLRNASPFKSLNAAASAIGASGLFKSGRHSVTTDYFEALGRLRLGDNVLSQRSLIERKDMSVNTVWQERADWGMPLITGR